MSRLHSYYTYMLTSRPHGTIYTGMTNDLMRRIAEHKAGKVGGFTKKYKVLRLVYFEEFRYVEDAIQREKTIKHWYRDWKINQIEHLNPRWDDLYPDLARQVALSMTMGLELPTIVAPQQVSSSGLSRGPMDRQTAALGVATEPAAALTSPNIISAAARSALGPRDKPEDDTGG